LHRQRRAHLRFREDVRCRRDGHRQGRRHARPDHRRDHGPDVPTLTGVTVTGIEGTAINAAQVATFTDSNPNPTFTATIDWDDKPSSPGTAVTNPNGSGFVVSGPDHTYADEGSYQAIVTVTDNLGSTVTVTNPVTVADAPLSIARVPKVIDGTEGTPI